MRNSVVLIGGSAGSFRPVCRILTGISKDFRVPVVLVLHRLRNINTGFVEALNTRLPGSGRLVEEPFDKEKLKAGGIYLAPANYHLCFEDPDTFSLNTDTPVQYSRPSIDMTFFSAAATFGKRTTAIMLSGANKDGVAGAGMIAQKGGLIIAQNPAECEAETMSVETSKKVKSTIVMSCDEIIAFLNFGLK